VKVNQLNPLKVLLIGNYAADQQQSMLGFAGALLSGLCARGIKARLLAPAQVFGRFGRPHAGVGKWLGYADKFGLFPRALRRALVWADVVHVCDQGNAMYIKYLKHTPHVLTCNDLMAIRAAHGEMSGWPMGRTGRLYQTLILGGINQAQHVACLSEATRQDLLRLSRVSAAKVSVIPEGLLSPYRPMPTGESAPFLASLGVSQTPFLLHVGGNQPYKNRTGVLAIYAALRRQTPITQLRLVLAGKPFSPELRQFIAKNNLSDHVIELTGLTNEQLRALYSRATALVFPSLYEGFGLPIIEAQACGCPVFTSHRAPMTEVGGSAAVYFDPTQPEQAAQIIADSLDAREEQIAAGFENIKRFTTDRMINDYMQLYQSLTAGTPRP